ncbi:glycosyltransferase 87 family protein [Paenibacillus rigui]|uniref:Glycosyltransferase RgtA/B/C/D-like domain-containing protein n=1 Tax=Paenibacillus rigui TaxID=554312 RepID=A0A229UN79_9BACL|nr:glycosyltransferase 87 family protein [Paenibacillus rigui]OXM84831.1 hypothetical protein CF651_18150 [Paenibacillus rigui]
MSLLKKQSLWIAMSLILIVSAGLCVYSISSYQGSGAASSGIGRPQQSFGGQGGGPAPGQRAGQGPQGQQRPQGAPAGDSASAQGAAARGGGGSAKGGPAPPAGGAGFGGRAGGVSADAAYSTPLAVYTVLFFLLAAAGCAWIARVKPALRLSTRQKQALVWTALGTGLLLRIAAAPWIAGHPFDISLFKSWAAAAADHLTGFYVNGSSDYPPFYVYILYAVGKLSAASALSPYFTLLIKLPSIVADVATAYLLYRVARKSVSFELSLLIAAFYTFNPAVFINSTFWGQVDSFFTLMVVGAAILLSRGRLAWATVVFTAAVLMKPQGILYLPLLGFELIRRKQWKPWLVAAASAIGNDPRRGAALLDRPKPAVAV